ncbi:hypothetical protein HYH02_015408 [Chlamydomonas schloesseri]|uniref:Uncharacterized protein n=1 Tax=Chlamydomonas schloesseri TaxID=2026947 RepID=A0A835S8C2_9CHLO|nr:hypothetical protein HYH02_015408 [Chlamydomonas schloesseri]|eukprot:KAG2422633.1 hypothetical protein HYH02_015408 [Chlamydomonas schloesseri]
MQNAGSGAGGSGTAAPSSSEAEPHAPSRARSAFAIHMQGHMGSILASSAGGTAQGTFLDRVRARYAQYQGDAAAQAEADEKAAEEKLQKDAEAKRFIESKTKKRKG